MLNHFFGTFFKQRFAGGAVVALCSHQTGVMDWIVFVLVLFVSTFFFGDFFFGAFCYIKVSCCTLLRPNWDDGWAHCGVSTPAQCPVPIPSFPSLQKTDNKHRNKEHG